MRRTRYIEIVEGGYRTHVEVVRLYKRGRRKSGRIFVKWKILHLGKMEDMKCLEEDRQDI